MLVPVEPPSVHEKPKKLDSEPPVLDRPVLGRPIQRNENVRSPVGGCKTNSLNSNFFVGSFEDGNEIADAVRGFISVSNGRSILRINEIQVAGRRG